MTAHRDESKANPARDCPAVADMPPGHLRPSGREKTDVANAAIHIRKAAALLEKHKGPWAQPLHDIARDLEAWIARMSRS